MMSQLKRKPDKSDIPAPAILCLIDTRVVSGPCRGLFQLVKYINSDRYRLIFGMFLSKPDKTSPAIEEASRRNISVDIMTQKRRYDPSLVRQCFEMARRHQPSIIQSHSYRPAFLAWLLKSRTGMPWIAFAHGYTAESFRMKFYNTLDRWLLRRADRVVTVSKSMARLLMAFGVNKSRISVVHNAIEPNDHDLDANGREIRQQLGLRPTDLLVGVIGRLSSEKGQSHFIRSFKEVSVAVPNAYGVLVGDGLDLPNLKALAKSLGLKKRIFFAGFREKMSPVYAALDVVAIPSKSEGLPNVALEAMLHGKPIVATRVGGIPEVLSNGLSKFIVPSGDSNALETSLTDLLRKPSLRAQLGEEGAQHVRVEFLPEPRARKMLAVYDDVLLNGG